MMHRRARAALLLALAFGAGRARAQSPDSAVATFITAARAGAERYRDQANAIADGYRRIGPDFPSMGEHWVSIARVASGDFVPERPPILEYILVEGRPVLAGAAWALPAGPGSALPTFPPGGHAWHYHSGTVDDESFVASHGDAGHHAPTGPTVAVLHAWLWLENPDGVFTTDNWSLPYARLGLSAPAGTPTGAARMLSLAAGGEHYFSVLARLVCRPESMDTLAVDAALGRARDSAVALAGVARTRGATTPGDVAALMSGWQRLWDEIMIAASPAARDRLAAVSGVQH